MRNYDEPILRSRRIDRAAPFAPLHQALRIALYDGYAARAFYSKVVEVFGPRGPFADIAKSEEKRVAALSALGRRFGVPLPLDPFPLETVLAPDWRANCERAVVGEIDRARLYESLVAAIADPNVRRALQRLQASAMERQLPTLQGAVADALRQEALHARQGVAPEQAYIQHGLIVDFLEKTFDVLAPQHRAIGVVGPLLRNARPAMLAGAVAGAAAVLFVRSGLKLNHDQQEKEG